MLYKKILKPIYEPISTLFETVWVKLLLGFPFINAIDWSVFTTPTTYWQGLGWLVLMDFASGILKAIFDPDERLDINKLIKTAYKISSYVILTAAVTVGKNTFPQALGWLQYAVYLLLFGKEIRSIFKNFGKLKGVVKLAETIQNKGISGIRLSDFSNQQDNEH